MKVIIKGDFTGVSGYARCARRYVEALYMNGIDVFVESHPKESSPKPPSPFWSSFLSDRSVPKGTPCDIFIHHETPQFWHPRDNAINLGYTTFETTGIPNKDLQGNPLNNWVAQCNRMDAILVPSYFNKRKFAESGVTTRIEVIPHIVDIPQEAVEPYDPAITKENKTKFLSVFQWNPRKDPVTLITSFLRANEKHSTLIMKTYGISFDKRNLAIIDKIRAIKSSFYDEPTCTISPIISRLSDKEILGLYPMADVYVTSTRGEGFGLPIAEAMANSLPVICPRGTAMENLVDDEVGYPVKFDWEPVSGMERLPYGQVYSPSTNWMKVNPWSLIKQIKQAHIDRTTTCKDVDGNETTVLKRKGKAAQDRVRDLFSEEVVVTKYRDVLRSLFSSKKSK